MTAVYHVLISDQLIAEYDEDRWPACLDLLERGEAEAGNPYSHWWLARDSDAPGDLGGAIVELVLSIADGRAVITGRRVIG